MTPKDVKLVELPGYRAISVAGPMASAEDAHPVHQRFVALLESTPLVDRLQNVRVHDGASVRSGALVYGDYSEPEPRMSMFKQLAFVDQGPLELRQLASFTGREAKEAEAGRVEHTPGGLYATVRHTGPYNELHFAVREMIYQVLASMDLRHSGGPILELYHDAPSSETGIHVTDICVPVVTKGVVDGGIALDAPILRA